MENKNLIGKSFGHLTVKSLNYSDNRGASWNCKCECGKEIILQTSHILGTKNRNPDKSCGCMNKAQDGNTIKHKRIYSIYKCMMNRCNNGKVDNYERYGGKGVTVCDEWNTFNPFLTWSLANGYKEDLTIDRKDSKNQYSPSNCRWVDYFVQATNKCIYKNNTTGYKGVSYSKDFKLYRAYIMRNKIKKELGYFKTLEEAVKARKDIEEKYIRTGTL